MPWPCKLEFEFEKDITPSGADIFNSLTLDITIAGSAIYCDIFLSRNIFFTDLYGYCPDSSG